MHHLQRALPAHLHMFGEVDLTHSAFAELHQDVVSVGDDGADEIGPLRRGAQRGAVNLTEPRVGRVLGTALRTVFQRAHTDSRRRIWSPTSIRCPFFYSCSPCTDIATPLRLFASCTKNSLSSVRTSAWRPLMVAS